MIISRLYLKSFPEIKTGFFSLNRNILLVLPCVLIISCAGSPRTQSNDFGNDIHSPAEIIKIMTESKIVYNLAPLENRVTSKPDSPLVLHNQFLIQNTPNGMELKTYHLADEDLKIFNQADAEFVNQNFDESLNLFKRLSQKVPDYAYVYTMIGDVFYSMGVLDSAEVYFLRAISINPVDYTAHWFLADTYWSKGMRIEALEYIIAAHLLNKNNPRLLKKLKYYKSELDDPWEDWSFDPQYRLSEEDNQITIESDSLWFGYALVKALWKYEPGYAKSMINSEPEAYIFNLVEESEAVISLLAMNKDMKTIEKIVSDGYFKEFFYYEMAAAYSPVTLLLLPPEDFQRMVTYVLRYH